MNINDFNENTDKHTTTKLQRKTNTTEGCS